MYSGYFFFSFNLRTYCLWTISFKLAQYGRRNLWLMKEKVRNKRIHPGVVFPLLSIGANKYLSTAVVVESFVQICRLLAGVLASEKGVLGPHSVFF